MVSKHNLVGGHPGVHTHGEIREKRESFSIANQLLFAFKNIFLLKVILFLLNSKHTTAPSLNILEHIWRELFWKPNFSLRHLRISLVVLNQKSV